MKKNIIVKEYTWKFILAAKGIVYSDVPKEIILKGINRDKEIEKWAKKRNWRINCLTSRTLVLRSKDQGNYIGTWTLE